ncbi:UDP-galactopyranose mutase [Sphingobium sp. HWE2-09]|uniref:UDP-galactopyranose mutase n=1 Tax=Sphingobium sp. HWE2-09 TaxID=3108390 RepID=UPI002DC67753|nr:UDP-galactopyranose mutase [Sphingobium sp. HWE2-09]
MRRFATERRVFFWEEAILCDHPLPYLEYHPFPADNVIALRPRVPHWWDDEARQTALRELLDTLVATSVPSKPILWFYTPMMLGFAGHVKAHAIIYDCMDELSAFRFADPQLVAQEASLMKRADVVFTGGYSLYEAKRGSHAAIHPFPSAVDTLHFAAARGNVIEPADQASIAGPRLGFYGVIDERIDLGLIGAVARARPDWHIVMIGPVVKIDPADLPRHPNIHWLGSRDYADLPAYLSGWNVALMPFAINDATRFISPTKTPEYLAAGRPVVSTPIVDVQRHYGAVQGVAIADGTDAFVAACEAALALPVDGAWRDETDALLATTSWDMTFDGMKAQMAAVSVKPAAPTLVVANDYGTSPAVHPAARRPDYDVLVVGAGFAGAVLAERLAAGSGKRVLVIDRRPHVAGNAYDHRDAAGILVHRYGPHIFHTNSDDVFAYLSRFTQWRPYEHRVLASVGAKLVPMPINRTTLNSLYNLNLQDEAAAAAFLADRAEPRALHTSEDVVVAAIGQELYETFFRGYTHKQWGLDPSQLDKSVTARVPTRTSTDDRYFLDKHQTMPLHGYTAMFEAMLDHPNITVQTGTDYRDVDVRAAHTVFTGPVDEYFNRRFGPLPYRSLHFEHQTRDFATFQPVATVNYPDEQTPYTRITEYKHLTGQQHARTSITYEYPQDEGDPYYPIPRDENQALYRRYKALADALPDVSFVGRLATYKYYNMDQVVGQALATYRRLAIKLGQESVA